MSTEELIRALKDPDYRDGLAIDHPAGEIAVDRVGGTAASVVILSAISMCTTCLVTCAISASTCDCNPDSWC